MKFEVALLGSLYPIVRTVLCGRKASHEEDSIQSEFRNCVKVEVPVLGSPSLISLMVSMDVKQN